MEFGFVQKGMLGISGTDLNGNIADEMGIDESEGIYVAKVVENSGAAKANLKNGDIIKSIDGLKMKTFADLTGYISSKNPGDIVYVSYLRNGVQKQAQIEITKNNTVLIPQIEMEVRNLFKEDQKIFDTKKGVRITRTTGELSRYDMRDYIITKVNDYEITNIDDLQEILREVNPRETLLIQMKNSRGEVERFRYTID